MKLPRFFFSAALLLLLHAAATPAGAQFRSAMHSAPPPSVLHPAPSNWWIGPMAGANLNTHSGDFTTDFCDCDFEDGSGAGLSVGLEVGHYLSSTFAVALKAVYSDLRADYSYQILEDAEVIDEGLVEDVLFERRNTVILGYFMLHPVLQLHPVNWLYLFAGPAVGVKTTATQEYTKVVTDERFAFELGDGDTRIVSRDTGELPRAESLRADLRIGIGANLRLSRSILFAPEASFGYPITTISDDDNWSAQAFHLIGILKFEL
ncbi:MAG: hypothetical protein RRA94_08510 [Bacteroidota bacterium]|nr:hypothetical protein [Bacteroidota bacterium]